MAGNVIHNVRVLGFASAFEKLDAGVEGDESKSSDSSSEEKAEVEELGVQSPAQRVPEIGEGGVIASVGGG